MTGSLVSSLALHALLLLLPFSLLRHGTNAAASGRHGESASAGQGSFFAAALHGSEVTVLVPAQVAIAPPSSEPQISIEEDVPQEEVEEIQSESTREAETFGPASSTIGGVAGPTTGAAGPPGSGTDPTAGAGDGGTGSDPVAASGPPGEVAMTPRVWVYPSIPSEIVRKRKINDYVLFQVLVSTDGSVKDVRILRAIPNCEECTQNTVDSARRLQYNPVLIAGRAVEVWTVPMTYSFKYK
jgi:outer membrane biosynthesis protein TonB